MRILICSQMDILRTSLYILSLTTLIAAESNEINKRAKLGEECLWAADCTAISAATCKQGKCQCLPYHVKLNETTCLRGSLLGFECLLDEQCEVRVPRSRCLEGRCSCQKNHVPFRRDACLAGSVVGGYCLSNEQCQLANKLSLCKFHFHKGYGHCVCQPGYHSYNNRSCGPTLGITCDDDNTCRALISHSHCKRTSKHVSVCMCDQGYTVSGDGKRCVLLRKGLSEDPVSISKRCKTTDQCQARDPYSHCLYGICRCIANTSHCNEFNTGCFNDTFQCRNGQCISWYFVCNGRKNCEDGSDEEECIPFNCPKEAFQCADGSCIPRSKVCNGRADCTDGDDEKKCFDTCNAKAFRCGDGACLPQYSYCNAIISCRDGSDEDYNSCVKGNNCPPDQFRCANGQCRSTAILCSGKDGCGDNSDEKRCHACFCDKP